MSGHTPGPWKVDAPYGAFGWEVVAADGLVCQMAHGPYKRAVAEPNARLIAKAPEMHALLWESFSALDLAIHGTASISDSCKIELLIAFRRKVEKLVLEIEGK